MGQGDRAEEQDGKSGATPGAAPSSANLTHPQGALQAYPRCDHVPLIG